MIFSIPKLTAILKTIAPSTTTADMTHKLLRALSPGETFEAGVDVRRAAIVVRTYASLKKYDLANSPLADFLRVKAPEPQAKPVSEPIKLEFVAKVRVNR